MTTMISHTTACNENNIETITVMTPTPTPSLEHWHYPPNDDDQVPPAINASTFVSTQFHLYDLMQTHLLAIAPCIF